MVDEMILVNCHSNKKKRYRGYNSIDTLIQLINCISEKIDNMLLQNKHLIIYHIWMSEIYGV